MNDTKEKILRTALKLFAQGGYEAVSTAMIAAELGITKGALYRHYRDKHAILDAIVQRMTERDGEIAEADSVPVGTAEEMPEAYTETSAEQMRGFTIDMFHYWTQDEFATDFRRLVTLEQYRSEEFAQLLAQMLTTGPCEYTADILKSAAGMSAEKAASKSAMLCGGMLLYYAAYDHAEDRTAIIAQAEGFINTFFDEL